MEKINNIKHVPVLFEEIIQLILPQMSTFFDGTFGYGGHTIGIINKIIDNKMGSKFQKNIFATDLDTQVYDIGLQNLTENISSNLQVSQNISDIKDINIYKIGYHEIFGRNLPKFDFILLDLGANMHHFKNGDRGFSIKLDGELDMRFDVRTKLTAKHIINEWRVEKIANLLEIYGDFSPGIATKITNNIYSHRKSKNINTTQEFSAILLESGLNNNRIAVVFQCIRIAVNDEFGNITKFLDKLDEISRSGTVVVIITFHSLEDKLVKYKLSEYTDLGTRELVNKHVIKPSFSEIKKNPASASAKLRIIKKI